MRVLWVNPSLMDYRVPVFKEIHDLLDGGLTVVYSHRRTPERVIRKLEATLGEGAVGLAGERYLTLGPRSTDMANRHISLPYQPGLLATVMKISADVVINEGFFQWAPAAMFKCFRQNLPFVITYERTHHTERNCPRWREAYRRLVIRHTDALLCSGPQCARYAETLGMPARRMILGHLAADTEGLGQQVDAITPEERERLRRELGIRGMAFLYVGRLNERKGVMPLVRAWARFTRLNHGAATLLLVGLGECREAIGQLIAQLNLRNVLLPGYQDYDRLALFYAAADVFVLPTLEDNWAMVVPEAMACGLPVVCSIFAGCATEMIQQGRNGWLIDPTQEADIIHFLQQCLHNREELHRMGVASREIIRQHTPYQAAQAVLEGCRMALDYHGSRESGWRQQPHELKGEGWHGATGQRLGGVSTERRNVRTYQR